jgi:serine/threonine-protein kinase
MDKGTRVQIDKRSGIISLLPCLFLPFKDSFLKKAETKINNLGLKRRQKDKKFHNSLFRVYSSSWLDDETERFDKLSGFHQQGFGDIYNSVLENGCGTQGVKMIGQLLDRRYQVIQVLGTGGFGQTYLAQDTRRPGNPICVVKHLKPASSDPQVFETAKRLFQSEAETLEQLGNHEQIPRLLAYFDENQEFYLVQEYIQGRPLSTELLPNQRWSEPQVIQMLQEVLSILEFVHSQGVIHRDIKPDNIIRRIADNKLVLVDFGAVKQIRTQMVAMEGQPAATVAIGTPGYMPTEQGQGKPRPNSDIYSLGIIGIQALTGKFPMELQEDPSNGEIIWQHLAPVFPGLAAVLTKMVRYHFKDRYQTATENLQALQQLTSADAGYGYAQPQYPNVPSWEPTLAVGGQRLNPPTPQPTPQPPVNTPTPPYNHSVNSGRQPASNSPDLLPLAIGAFLTSLAVAGGVIAYRVLPVGSWFSGQAGRECLATVVSGSNIRSEPTSRRKNIITTLKDETPLEVTGRRTSSGWMEVRLDGGELAWAHTDVIANPSEVNSCLEAKGVDVQTVDQNDIIAGNPVAVPSPTDTPIPSATTKPTPKPTVAPPKGDNTPPPKPTPSPTTTPSEDGKSIFDKAQEARKNLEEARKNIEQANQIIEKFNQAYRKGIDQGNWDDFLALKNDPIIQKQLESMNQGVRSQVDKLIQQAEQKAKEAVDKAKETPLPGDNSKPQDNPTPDANQSPAGNRQQ